MNVSKQSLAAAAVLALAAGCRSAVPADAPGEPTPAPAVEVKAPAVADTARRGYTAADVRFVRHMIHHHAQALDMTALVPARTQRPALRLLAERIEVSQRDEIAQMRRWLEKRGEEVPPLRPDAGHHPGAGGHGAGEHHARMPGMLSPEELARLAGSTGTDFERLFLEYMIRHHEGALVMVADLFGSPGAGQEPEIYAIASEVDAGQRAEIARMRALLETLPSSASP